MVEQLLHVNQEKQFPLTVNDFDADEKLNLEILLELGNIGAGKATTALSEMVNEKIEVEVPKLYVSPPHMVPQIFGKHDDLMAIIHMELSEEPDCDVLLIFDVEEAKKIAAMMSMCSVEELDPEMESSAIEELGNIMIGGFLSAISDFTSIELLPTPPQLVRGSFEAVLDTFLVKQAMMSDVALVFDGCFRRSSSKAGGTIVVFPSKEMQQVLITKGKEWMG
ncbi:MAG: hypothetical protein CW716_08280 [Candidatus Bathyarchaeum sp.]|nr:MAG: hypothetical protein CW716_08280 [Candidatus Bathyarchaeum sp.]